MIKLGQVHFNVEGSASKNLNKMNQTRRYRYTALAGILVILLMLAGQSVMAQLGPPPPPPPTNPPAGAPIDGGTVLLISSCLAYAWYKLKK